MTATTNDAPAYATSGSPYFSLMLAVLAAVVILSGIGGSKAVVLGPIITDGGFFLFPLAYIIGDVITEIYGAQAARIAIITGLIVNIMSALAYGIIIALPGFDDEYGHAKQAAIVGALGPVWIVVLAGMLGFLGG
ncbi:MAG: VUT family protein, partial [Propionibacteriaceae bacterium]